MSTTAITAARKAITEALSAVVPAGRCTPYPRTNSWVGTAVWLDVPAIVRTGTNADRINFDFPVWLVADGTNDAQIAELDELQAVVWDELDRMTRCTPQMSKSLTWSPEQTAPTTPRRLFNAVQIIARWMHTARTMCPIPAPEPAAFPAQLIQT